LEGVAPHEPAESDANSVEPEIGSTEESGSPPEPLSVDSMLEALHEATGIDFATHETRYGSYAARAQLAVQESDFYDRLVAIHEELSADLVAGKIRAIESWSDGETEFRVVTKSWPSLIDKLYRINREENRLFSNPPLVKTIEELARGVEDASQQRWITPDIAHEAVDDILRTKIVVPFVDAVVEVGDKLTHAFDDLG
jgi:hypothetical protein